MRSVPLQLPVSLTPSKVSAFKECALAFRLSVIDRLPEPPSLPAFKGTVVHRALELLMWEEREGERTISAALARLERALGELLVGPEGTALALAGKDLGDLVEDARSLVRNYFELEDPNAVHVIGTELRLEVDLREDPGRLAGHSPGNGTVAPDFEVHRGRRGHLLLRGIIDRLELDKHGDLVVTDYKTGRAPSQAHEQARLGGAQFYAFLCEQVLGKRPVRVQLLHLREPLAIWSTPSDQSITGLERQASAVWAAVEKACLHEDFRPRPGPLCAWCGYHAYCPAMGGDLALANTVRGGARRPGHSGHEPELPQLSLVAVGG